MAEPIYDGKPNFETGMTPYGFYDAELSGSGEDKGEADKFAEWAARRLGYPIMSIEIQSGSFYACLEEAISEYSAHVHDATHIFFYG